MNVAEDRYLGIAKETAYGTAVAPTKYIDFSSFSVNPVRENLYPPTAQRRELVWKKEGPVREKGSLEVEVRPDEIDSFAYWGLGSGTTTAAGDSLAYQHMIRPSEHEIYSFTTEAGSIGTYARRINGCFITSLKFEAAARENLTCSLDITGRSETLVTPAQSQTFQTELPFAFHEAAVTLGGSSFTTMEAFRVSIENSVDEDAFVLGNQFLPGIRLEGINVTGDIELTFNSWTEYQRFLASTTATTFGVQNSFALKVIFTSVQTTGSVSVGYENYLIEFDLPAIHYDTVEVNEEKRDRIVMTASYTALYNTSSAYAVRVKIINTNSTL